MDKNDTVKHPSASVNPVNQLLDKLGKILDLIGLIGSNKILPLTAFLLYIRRNSLKLCCLLGRTRSPLNKELINSNPFLSSTIYLEVRDSVWG